MRVQAALPCPSGATQYFIGQLPVHYIFTVLLQYSHAWKTFLQP